MNHYTTPRRTGAQDGFTLVELSIVLVIIGLIVGGVLVGQDLIKAAEVRSTVGQIEKYNSALNTFRTRYGAIPGDIANAAATSFGMVARNGGAGRGDSNGLVQGSGAVGALTMSGEAAMFWNDLSVANLVDGAFSGDDTAAGMSTSATLPVAGLMPPAKIGRGNHIAVFSNGGLNFYEVSGVTAVAAGAYTLSDALTPTESLNMDNKIDDGLPTTGVVQTRGDVTLDGAATAGAGGATAAVCNNTTPTPNTYNTLNNSPLCKLRFRFN